MKHHINLSSVAVENFYQAIAALHTAKEAKLFLADLCTPAELEAMIGRWQVVPLLQDGKPYQKIYEETGVSVTTVGRVARCLNFGSGGYALIAKRIRTRKK